MAKSPIFIHSLFRAGSTYVFSRLRRCPGLYCYYESMHELVAWASEDVTRLDIESRADKMQQLHHPVLERPYFEELKAAWPAWQQALAPTTVYGGYFAEEPCAAGEDFFLALCAASPAQPLFSECRTAGRMSALKKSVGGKHAYLWRNPWDQWWSYQIDPYFDAATRVIAHANPLPEPLRALQTEFDIAGAPLSSFSEARDFYDLRPLDFEASYAWFYGLWLYLLGLASTTADLMINIDALGRDSDHTDEVSKALVGWGVSNPDFSDACSPVACYTTEEAEAFTAVESRVHSIYDATGWDAERLGAALALREQYRVPESARAGNEVSEAEHRRTLLSVRTHGLSRAEKWAGLYDWQSRELDEARHDVAALHRALEHDRKVLAELKNRNDALADANVALQSEAELRETELGLARLRIEQLTASVSWRVTAPMRSLVELTSRAINKGANTAWVRDWLGPKVIDLVARFPFLLRLSKPLLQRFPRLRLILMGALGISEEVPDVDPDTDPAALSARGVALYNQLARELTMPELPGAEADTQRARS
jgi:hypothetical protein